MNHNIPRKPIYAGFFYNWKNIKLYILSLNVIIILGGFMVKYKNEKQLREVIMGQGRHQFIYGFDSIQKRPFLENVAGM